MLYQVSNEWECGFVEDFISHSNNGYSIDTPNVKQSNVKVFKYHTTTMLKPNIINMSNQNYIVPGWIPCHPDTQLSDIIWTQKLPKEEKLKEIDTWRFKSSSGEGEYVTKKNGFKYTCNCPGFWRAKDRECKHIKEVKCAK